MQSFLFLLLFSPISTTYLVAQSTCDCYERLSALSDYYTSMEKYDLALETFQDILAILKQAQGECLDTKKNIALLIDRREVWKNEAPQIYGLWNSLKREGKYAPFRNLGEVDALRLEYNLLRLEEQSKVEKLELPEGYKTIPYPDNYFCGYDFKD